MAGYLAKYSTKSATDSVDGGNPHLRRPRAVLAETAARIQIGARADGIPLRDHPYAPLGKWRHMLGFRGHFSSKSRRYSVTLGRLRRSRVRSSAASPRRTARAGPWTCATSTTSSLMTRGDHPRDQAVDRRGIRLGHRRRIHDLRHTAACLWLARGVGLERLNATPGVTGGHIHAERVNDNDETPPDVAHLRWSDGVSRKWS